MMDLASKISRRTITSRVGHLISAFVLLLLPAAPARAAGALTLKVDDRPAVTATKRVRLTAMPADGLDVGSDEGGAVGPYSTPNKFTGTIEVITVELDKL